MDSWRQTLAELAAGQGTALKRHAFLLCGDDAKAEDLLREALIRAFARPLRAPRRDNAAAQVRAIMVTVFIDGVRRSSGLTTIEPLPGAAAPGPDPADGAVDRDVVDRDTVLAALGCLSPSQRACVVLRYHEDLPVAAISTALGVADETVRRHLSDAMTQLAGPLSGTDGEQRAEGASR
jgi:RNA polymerase sigma factor (sigma-70 family)